MKGRSATYRWLAVASAVFAMAWGGNQFTPLLTVYRDQLHFADQTVYALLMAYIVGLIPVLLLGSRLASRWGEVPVVWTGLLLGAAGSTVLASATSSIPLMTVGRLLAGISIGIGMTAGVSLIRRLRLESRPGETKGAVLSSSMTVTAGLACGAVIAGLLGSVSVQPTVAPYVTQVLISVVAGLALLLARPIQRTEMSPTAARLKDRESTPVWILTATTAPWVFVAGSVAYGLVPGLVRDIPSSAVPAYAAACAATTLVFGTAIQPWAGALLRRGGTPITLALTLIAFGLLAVAGVASTGNAVLGIVASVPLGAGFGIALGAGILRTQWVIARTGLEGLTGAYFALCYLGFAAPVVLSLIAPLNDYTSVVVATLALAIICTVGVAVLERSPSQQLGQ